MRKKLMRRTLHIKYKAVNKGGFMEMPNGQWKASRGVGGGRAINILRNVFFLVFLFPFFSFFSRIWTRARQKSWYFFPVYHKSTRHKNSNYLRPIPRLTISIYFFGPSSVGDARPASLNCKCLQWFFFFFAELLDRKMTKHSAHVRGCVCVCV